MLKLRKVGVTGRLASGKSLVCSVFKQHGAYVESADEVVHQLLTSDQKNIQRIISLLGQDVEENGRIDRIKVAEIVFSDKKKLSELEKILHPQVLDKLKQCYEKLQKQNEFSLYVVEAPLLFEAHWEGFFDTIITVVAHDELCKKRYEDTGHTDYLKRISRFMPVDEMIKKTDFIIKNNEAQKEVEKQTLDIINKL
ncbi:dephospho-CoA kinase [Candidatus Aerophobetes bacterium]|uniref:Dephospho-CoA kinase n=1 Tax=Aerophobetes bacterium TaxID=2030807 RepID=A0A2A4YMC1_UNCAE|nr:MAG: dephospho-CoA kinase [Candidatus Aerophobetes bacterium]